MRKVLTRVFPIFWFTIFSFAVFALPEIEEAKDLVKNIQVNSIEEGLELSWGIDYEYYSALKENDYSISIEYAPKSVSQDERQSVLLNLNETNYTLKNLIGDETYSLRIGVVNDSSEYWSDDIQGNTKRGWGLFRFLTLIGSLGLFIYGMQIMSEGIQQAAGHRLRYLLSSITSNRFKGVLTGFGITSLVQSSSVTTVMTVSFVNAGLLTLLQAVGVIMGANIGTTVTGWIINFLGFELDLSLYVLILIAFAAPLMFIGSKPKLKAAASAVVGFSILFIGLEFLKGAVPTLDVDSPLIEFFITYKDIPFFGTVLFVLLGALVTIIVQSSSAAMALTMTLVAGGILPFEVAAAMILGENIGTTVTAQLAAIVGNVHAKRAAWIHTLFNLFGVIWAIIFFSGLLSGIKWFMTDIIAVGDPFKNPQELANTGLAILHTSFNLINLLALVWFAPTLVRISERIVKSKGEEDEEFHLDYIGSGLMTTPDLALLEAKKEIAKFGEITSRMSIFTRDLLFEKNKKQQRKIAERIAKYEEITDRVEIEIANYLNKISEGRLSMETIRRIRGMNSIVGDLERIGDIFFEISKDLERKVEEKYIFTDLQRKNLAEMFDLIDEAFKIMCVNLNKHSAEVDLTEALQAEENINQKRDELKRKYLQDLSEDGALNMEGIILYQNIFLSLARVGGHIINVSEGVKGKI